MGIAQLTSVQWQLLPTTNVAQENLMEFCEEIKIIEQLAVDADKYNLVR